LRRVLRRASRLRIEVGEPLVDDERLDLYRRWHTSREEARGWKPDRIGVESYAMQFCFPHAAAREFSYWDGQELIGIGTADETPHALSAVYCYYDPERSRLSIGTYNVLHALEYRGTAGSPTCISGTASRVAPRWNTRAGSARRKGSAAASTL